MRRIVLPTLLGSALIVSAVGIVAPAANAERDSSPHTAPAAEKHAEPAHPVPAPPADRTGRTAAKPAGLVAPATKPAPLRASVADARARQSVDSAAVPGQSDPVEDPYYPDYSQPELDALHYWLDLRWDGSTLNGFTTVDLRAAKDTETLNLALNSTMKVTKAWLDGKEVQATQSGTLATFKTGHLAKDATARLQVQYTGQPQCVRGPSPRPDLQCIGWNKKGDRVWTIQQPYGAFTWYPVSDTPSDKALYDARITTTNGKVGVFNGVPINQWDKADGNTVVRNYHLDSPATAYLTTLAIGDYKPEKVKLNDGKEWTVWYTPAEQSAAAQAKTEAVRAYDFMTKQAGTYPFSSIGNVMIPSEQAMETQTMITMGTREMHPVLMHELGHHWFGDTVSPRTWKDMWLNEGWTMYMQGRYEGTPISQFQQSCRASVPTAGQAGSPRPDHFAENNVYMCPATIFDTIRRELGDQKFTEIATAWPADHKNQSVDRAEFERWLKAKTGKDYSQLISQWLDRA